MVRMGRESYSRGNSINLKVELGKGIAYKGVIYCGLIDSKKSSPAQEIDIKTTMGEFEYPNVITIYPKTKIEALDPVIASTLDYFCNKYTNGVRVMDAKGNTCVTPTPERMLEDAEQQGDANVEDPIAPANDGLQSFNIFILGNRFNPESTKIYERIISEFND